MSIRSFALASVMSVSLAAIPSVAQAGDDEEIFALGALAGAVALVAIGALGVGANRLERRDASANRQAHIDYCTNRYRTYRVSDGTFQPNNGPRRLCRSPFAG